MNGTIRFPHLGITLHQVIKTVSVGNLEIACYGIVLAAAMVTGLLLVMKVADKTGQKGDDYFDLGMVAIVVSVLCARIYYVVFSWDYYREPSDGDRKSAQRRAGDLWRCHRRGTDGGSVLPHKEDAFLENTRYGSFGARMGTGTWKMGELF